MSRGRVSLKLSATLILTTTGGTALLVRIRTFSENVQKFSMYMSYLTWSINELQLAALVSIEPDVQILE